MDQDRYAQKLEQQKQQYQAGEEIHDLPDIFHYWSNKYLLPKLVNVFGCTQISDFYVNAFADLFAGGNEQVRLVSIGSGDSDLEVKICKSLLSRGSAGFSMKCLDVNDRLIEEARKRIAEQNLGSHMTAEYFDINRQTLDLRISGFMANHSLHHVLELEKLFEMIDRCLIQNGRFVSNDMIGRNGHMRWPETLAFVEAFWSVLPDQKKYHHQLKQHHKRFVNFDCSMEGFEGVRAQDILPLLRKDFSFASFLAFGGLPDIFVDRGYGPNFSAKDPFDIAFIDSVEATNEGLLSLGLIKPTAMFADMRKGGVARETRVHGHLTPEFCTRVPFL
jgi:ubiquinone/menaquinone biosynthesis C-methylase UbiE